MTIHRMIELIVIISKIPDFHHAPLVGRGRGWVVVGGRARGLQRVDGLDRYCRLAVPRPALLGCYPGTSTPYLHAAGGGGPPMPWAGAGVISRRAGWIQTLEHTLTKAAPIQLMVLPTLRSRWTFELKMGIWCNVSCEPSLW